MERAYRPCAIVPTFDNPATVRRVVEAVRAHLDDVIVVDDASHDLGRQVVTALADDGLATVHHRAFNGGKGAAVKDGLRIAHERGFTHALQIDADGQHDVDAIDELLDASRRAPDALVLGTPVFDDSAPRARLMARRITIFWTRVETGGDVIADPQCGFRVYPVGPALAADARGDRMDFDIEIAVRMAWANVPVVNVPTKVRYVPEDEGGVSHFRVVRDNVAISLMHSRLVLTRWLRGLTGRPVARHSG